MSAELKAVETNVTQFRTDEMLAKEIYAELLAAMQPVCKTLDKARAAGLHVNLSFGPDPFGRTVMQNVSIVRPLPCV